jgi:hypothetical protein
VMTSARMALTPRLCGEPHRVPLQWATTQNNLGTALSTLGKRESGTSRLEEVVFLNFAHSSLGGVAPLDFLRFE